MNDRLQRLIRLINKTGDKLIVFDQASPEEPYVISRLSDYEKLALGSSRTESLTEDELIDKINSDIVQWKNGQIHNESSVSPADGKSSSPDEAAPKASAAWRPPKAGNSARVHEQPGFKGQWNIPESRRREADEIS